VKTRNAVILAGVVGFLVGRGMMPDTAEVRVVPQAGVREFNQGVVVTPPPTEAAAPSGAPAALPEPVPSNEVVGDPAPSVNQLLLGQTRYATARIRIRQEPSTSSPTLGMLNSGSEIVVGEPQGDWAPITSGQYAGAWVAAGYLAAQMPQALIRSLPIPAAPSKRQPQQKARLRQPGAPIRDPYVGTCDCPYDVMRNGAVCGNRSAYRKPGGRSPVCYE
jgi:hypothetical protein